MYPGKPITKKVTKMYPGKPITNLFRVNQLGLREGFKKNNSTKHLEIANWTLNCTRTLV